MKSHKDLIVWQKAMSFVEEIYSLSKGFPDEEKYGLTAQLRRASVSIPSNISEGAARHGKNSYIFFIWHWDLQLKLKRSWNSRGVFILQLIQL